MRQPRISKEGSDYAGRPNRRDSSPARNAGEASRSSAPAPGRPGSKGFRLLKMKNDISSAATSNLPASFNFPGWESSETVPVRRERTTSTTPEKLSQQFPPICLIFTNLSCQVFFRLIISIAAAVKTLRKLTWRLILLLTVVATPPTRKGRGLGCHGGCQPLGATRVVNGPTDGICPPPPHPKCGI